MSGRSAASLGLSVEPTTPKRRLVPQGYGLEVSGVTVPGPSGPGEEFVTANMFSFGAAPAFGGVRLWVIAKSGFYSGGAATVSILDPIGAGGTLATTTQPAHTFGSTPAGQGTCLVSYSGLSDGASEYVQWIRIDNPLGAATFAGDFVLLGNLEDNPMTALAGAPQSGSSVSSPPTTAGP